MTSKIRISAKSKDLIGDIQLSGSKSISNRVLIIQSLCPDTFSIENLSDSDDTITLERLLMSEGEVLDAHHAGTTFRFMTAYCALLGIPKTITGSTRMQQRPIGILVDALRALGAIIEYVDKEGYPPIKIINNTPIEGGKISIDGSVSSQFITSLLLIAPALPKGLEIEISGTQVSQSYIDMTIATMEHFGIQVLQEGRTITVTHQTYRAKSFFVESDWSAASYYYGMAAMSDNVDITIRGLLEKSVQGDAAIASLCQTFGLKTQFLDRQIKITKISKDVPDNVEFDLINTPDIAQTLAVICAGLGITTLFSGLQTLKVKETDRIAALTQELAKVSVFLSKLPQKFSSKSQEEFYLQEGKAESAIVPIFDTYQDHRMAMAFAILGLLFPVEINNPEVVSKSYPLFWKDLASLGFEISH